MTACIGKVPFEVTNLSIKNSFLQFPSVLQGDLTSFSFLFLSNLATTW